MGPLDIIGKVFAHECPCCAISRRFEIAPGGGYKVSSYEADLSSEI